MRYREARASFLSATEEVTGKTITYFFQLLLAREQLAIARQNLENSEKLYKIAEAKRRIGQISENDRLQLRLDAQRACRADRQRDGAALETISAMLLPGPGGRGATSSRCSLSVCLT